MKKVSEFENFRLTKKEMNNLIGGVVSVGEGEPCFVERGCSDGIVSCDSKKGDCEIYPDGVKCDGISYCC